MKTGDHPISRKSSKLYRVYSENEVLVCSEFSKFIHSSVISKLRYTCMLPIFCPAQCIDLNISVLSVFVCFEKHIAN